MKIKISEATNLQLDWLVAKAQGKLISLWLGDNPKVCVKNKFSFEDEYLYKPATDWAQGGPIIEREKLSLDMLCAPDEWRSALMEGDFYDDQGEWIEGSSHEQTGPTPLIAAMRCFVASKLGDEVEVPDELS